MMHDQDSDATREMKTDTEGSDGQQSSGSNRRGSRYSQDRTEALVTSRDIIVPREGPLVMGGGRPFPTRLPDPEAYVVEFDDLTDPTHPHNWHPAVKYCVPLSQYLLRGEESLLTEYNRLYVSCVACFGTFAASFSSAIFATGISGASEEFNVSAEIGNLGTALFVLGFASGPVLWAPVSELAGRRWPLTIGMLGGGIFCISAAVSKDIQTLIICRFFSGLCGASQLSVVPAVLADLYDNTTRGVAITLYSLTVFVGPFSAPFIGGFIASSYLGWRWTLYVPAILTFLGFTLDLLLLKETYAQALLVNKAVNLRRQTQNWGIHAKKEHIEVNFGELVSKTCTRPLRILVTEPIVLLISLFMSFIYGLVYALLEAYPYVFEDIRGMRPGVSGLPFIGLIIGQLLACCFIISQHSAYAKKLTANHNIPIPEWRLAPTIIGGPAFTAGIFWYAHRSLLYPGY